MKWCNQMSSFQAKMHQIRFQLRLRCGSLQRYPDRLARFQRPTSKGREWKGGKGRAGKRRGKPLLKEEGRGEGERWRRGRGRERKGVERRGKGKREAGEERKCAVEIFNYFRLWYIAYCVGCVHGRSVA